MQKKDSGFFTVAALLLGELAVSALTAAVFSLLGYFSYKVITGVLLGSAVAVLNLLILTVSVNRAVDRFMALRGDKEMSDEEAEQFAAKHAAEISNVQRASFLIRSFSMMGALVLAFITKQFDVIATVIPLLAFQPILIATELLKRKKGA